MADENQGTPLFVESPTATILVDPEGVIVDANPMALKTLARSRRRVVGEPLLGFVQKEDRRRARDLFQKVLMGRGHTWTARINRGDGVPRVQTLRAVPLMNGAGPRGILLFARDLQAGTEGKPEAVQLQTLLENLPEQFSVVLDQKGRIRYSSGLSRTHFIDDLESLGVPFRDFLDDDELSVRALESMLEAVSGGEDWAGTQWHARKDGSSFPAQVFASPYRDPRTGRTRGALVVGRDASLVHRWRERAETAEPLASVGKLVAAIGRELKESLDRVGASLDRREDEGWEESGIEEVREEIRSMERFLGHLETFAGKPGIERKKVSLSGILQRSLEAVQDRARESGVIIETAVSPGLPDAWADAEGLTRVLDALLENALDALEEEGEGGELDLSVTRRSNSLLLKMVNAGSAVKPEWMQRIFDPFFTTRPGRTGLGLAVARGVVQSHGGRIWAESPSPGTLGVSVEIPLEPPETRLPFRPVPLTLARSRSILVVDDDEAIRATLRAFLEKVGFEVREAWSGRSALAQLTTGRRPELVLTDLRMDDGSGYWFLNALKKDFPELVARTIIITGDTRVEAATELARETGCPLIRKPFELPRLLDTIDEVSLQT